MDRLTPETLGRLVDHEPTPLEEALLARYPDDVEELESLRRMTEALGALPDVRPPRGDWEVLEARLVSEGLVQGRGGFGPRRAPNLPAWMQIAAALVLFVAGVGLGTGFRPAPATAGSLLADGAAAFTQRAGDAGSLEEAAEIVRLTEQPYYAALARYQQLSAAARGGELPADGDPTVRMAALEALLAASRAAIRQAPGDTFLNGILVSTTAEREAYLRRISAGPRDNWF